MPTSHSAGAVKIDKRIERSIGHLLHCVELELSEGRPHKWDLVLIHAARLYAFVMASKDAVKAYEKAIKRLGVSPRHRLNSLKPTRLLKAVFAANGRKQIVSDSSINRFCYVILYAEKHRLSDRDLKSLLEEGSRERFEVAWKRKGIVRPTRRLIVRRDEPAKRPARSVAAPSSKLPAARKVAKRR